MPYIPNCITFIYMKIVFISAKSVDPDEMLQTA